MQQILTTVRHQDDDYNVVDKWFDESETGGNITDLLPKLQGQGWIVISKSAETPLRKYPFLLQTVYQLQPAA